MKTFKEFLNEVFNILETNSRTRHGNHATSREEAEARGLNYFLPSDGEWRVLRPSGRGRGKTVKKTTSVALQKLRRKHRGEFATHPDADLKLTSQKLTTINRGLNKQAHHIHSLESLSHLRDMTPEQRKAYIEKQEREKVYLGNDRRAIMAVSPEEHERIHAFQRKNQRALTDIENAITPQRAYTTLVNRERRRRRAQELQARMAKGAERHGITND